MARAGTSQAPVADQTGGGFYLDAEVYEALHASDAPSDVRMLKRIWRQHGHARPGTALEPACGPGRHLRLLARDGWDVVGIDLEPAMIAHAQRAFDRVPGPSTARFIAGDMAALGQLLPSGSVDLAFCLINSIRHLPSDAAMLRHLRGIEHVLKPDGIYVVGLSISWYGHESTSEDVWTGRLRVDNGTIAVKQVVTYQPPESAGKSPPASRRFETVLSHLEITRTAAGTVRTEHADHVYRLRTYNAEQWLSSVRRAGLQVRAVLDVHGDPQTVPSVGYGVFVLARPEPGGTSARARRSTTMKRSTQRS